MNRILVFGGLVLLASLIGSLALASSRTNPEAARQQSDLESIRASVVHLTVTSPNSESTEQGMGLLIGSVKHPPGLVILAPSHLVLGSPSDSDYASPRRLEVHFFEETEAETTTARVVADTMDVAVVVVNSPEHFTWRKNLADLHPYSTLDQRRVTVWYVGSPSGWDISPPGVLDNHTSSQSSIEIEGIATAEGYSGAALVTSKGVVGIQVEDEGGTGHVRPLAIVKQALERRMREHGARWTLRPMRRGIGHRGVVLGGDLLANQTTLSGSRIDAVRTFLRDAGLGAPRDARPTRGGLGAWAHLPVGNRPLSVSLDGSWIQESWQEELNTPDLPRTEKLSFSEIPVTASLQYDFPPLNVNPFIGLGVEEDVVLAARATQTLAGTEATGAVRGVSSPARLIVRTGAELGRKSGHVVLLEYRYASRARYFDWLSGSRHQLILGFGFGRP